MGVVNKPDFPKNRIVFMTVFFYARVGGLTTATVVRDNNSRLKFTLALKIAHQKTRYTYKNNYGGSLSEVGGGNA